MKKTKALSQARLLKKHEPKMRAIKSVQKELWDLCKTIIRKKYGNTCFTCGARNLSGVNWHTGHFIPKGASGAFLKYDLRNLRPQCFHCNINLGGNGTMFYKNMMFIEGAQFVDALFSDKNKIVPKPIFFYLELIDKYKEYLKTNRSGKP